MLTLFIITWLTATILLLWLGDHNLYVKYPNGSVMIKDILSPTGRIFDSLLFAGVYGIVNTVLFKVWQRFVKIHTKDSVG